MEDIETDLAMLQKARRALQAQLAGLTLEHIVHLMLFVTLSRAASLTPTTSTAHTLSTLTTTHSYAIQPHAHQ
jgi:hypothetical protein